MNDLRAIDLNLLVGLEALLQERSVTRAATRLGLTQPAMSGMLGRLRDLFGDPLFVRAPGGLAPTPFAESLTPTLAQLLVDARRLLNRAEFDPSRADLTFTVAANDYLQRTLLVPLVRALRDRAPGIRMALRPVSARRLSNWLSGGEVDLALTFSGLVPAGLRSVELYEERHVCAVRKSHPYRGRRISVERFCEFEHVLVAASHRDFEGPMDEALRALGATRRVVMSVPNYSVLTELLEVDDLIAVVPERFVSSAKGRRLRSFAPPVELSGFDVVAAWHPRTDGDPARVWLRSLLSEVTESAR